MRIGASLFIIAIGAILTFAVTDNLSGVNVHVVGVILMLVGIVGLVLELMLWGPRRRTTVITRTPGDSFFDPNFVEPHTTYVEHTDPADRY
jgi:Domain of unknown function (DUF6458)